MAPTSAKRLVSAQSTRLGEIQMIGRVLLERPRETLTMDIITSRIEEIKGIWTDLRGTHIELSAREDAQNEAYIINGTFFDMRKSYEETLDQLFRLKGHVEKTREEARTVSPSTSARGEFGHPTAKLPKIGLPHFSGHYEQWESFRGLFTSLIHSVRDLSNAAKLQYLKSCLHGAAAELIEDVDITDDNYLPTWEALNERFHNPRLTVVNHFNTLWNLPSVKRESASELRAFVDAARRVIRALKSLGLPVEQWDIWFTYILTARLDSESRKLWEAELSTKDRALLERARRNEGVVSILDRFPKFKDLIEFMECRAQTLTMATSDQHGHSRAKVSEKPQITSRRVHHAAASRQRKMPLARCELCRGPHGLRKCSRFLASSPSERHSEVKRLNLCYNCMGPHRSRDCTSKFRCEKCRGSHHTLLHFESRDQGSRLSVVAAGKHNRSSPKPTNEAALTNSGDTPPAVNVLTGRVSPRTNVLLSATAILSVASSSGAPIKLRALLDTGSEVSLISEAAVQLLGMPRERINVPITGIGTVRAGTCEFSTRIMVLARVGLQYGFSIDVLLLPRLTTCLPSREIVEFDHSLFDGMNLADPLFYKPGKVDLILGLNVYGLLIRPGIRYLNDHGLIAQDSVFGWVISGPLSGTSSRRAEGPTTSTAQDGHSRFVQSLHLTTPAEIQAQLQQFWAVEEVPSHTDSLSPEEQLCEDSFRTMHTRDESGRFCVSLPLRSEPPSIGRQTRGVAEGSLRRLHRRFGRSPQLQHAYVEFMNEYERLGHMVKIPDSELSKTRVWYLPHHPVLRSTGPDFRIRVVFDASRSPSGATCLNDHLLPGPALQMDLSLVLTNWRQYRFAFTADIIKMFRQIRVKPTDQDLQRILWSRDPDGRPIEYRLTTVTYGTSCAPFLALRTLKQLADSEKDRYPLGAKCLNFETYVDDSFSGASDLETARQVKNELVAILRTAGIELSKWAANHPDLRDSDEDSEINRPDRSIVSDDIVKALGIQWNPSHDRFKFAVDLAETEFANPTKRLVLSVISRIFDPLGWISPVIIIAKILLQDIWIMNCEWDGPLPQEILERWRVFCRNLKSLPDLSLDRWIASMPTASCQLHGFSDASKRAYAAAVYIRVDDGNGNVCVSLLASKTKVSPIKTLSIPNLELCGASLLVKLLLHLQKLEWLRALPVNCWTDSQIVIQWLSKHPSQWRTFVANRTSEIQCALPNANWNHVISKDNPADIATRGLGPQELRDSELWWKGPSWLKEPSTSWTRSSNTVQVMHASSDINEPAIIRKFSTLSLLERVIAYCLRPVKIRLGSPRVPDLKSRILGPLELADARVAVIRIVQSHFYKRELSMLSEGCELPVKHAIAKLYPYVDPEQGLLRVGGRLDLSTLTTERKHPPILPASSFLSRLFVRHAHLMTLHGGPTLTANFVNQMVWITGRSRLVKSVIHQCLICQRHKPQMAHQLMGSLPAVRVVPSRPFSVSGLDYAGPFNIRMSRGRGIRASKGYIALFVCFATKAVHLELVSDLTTDTFIAAFRRFVGRRGICSRLFSDNASGFRGADTELQRMFQAASEHYHRCKEVLANDGTDWTFIPPTTPHYGGLWEAGVKSTKHHLRRVLGENILTFEEMTTLLVEIESCLNSRPLRPLTSDAEDLNALTPSHFLIGTTSALLPDVEPFDVQLNRLDRFQLLQRLRNQFWKRWSSEYLQGLQERNKWRGSTVNFQVGQLVLMRNERYPPSKWPLGRVSAVHPGPDGLVRVVTIRAKSGNFKRHISRLCPLILEDEALERSQEA